jgi:hypothetical protein
MPTNPQTNVFPATQQLTVAIETWHMLRLLQQYTGLDIIRILDRLIMQEASHVIEQDLIRAHEDHPARGA